MHIHSAFATGAWQTFKDLIWYNTEWLMVHVQQINFLLFIFRIFFHNSYIYLLRTFEYNT